MKRALVFIVLLYSFLGFSQKEQSSYRTKRIAIKDSIKIDSVSINPSRFIVRDKNGKIIDSSLYNIDFVKSLLVFRKTISTDTVEVDYLRYPAFITKVYKQLDDNIIVNRSSSLQKLYQLENTIRKNTFTPFDGLTTSGSISRGVTIGNNQNSVF